MELRHLRYFVAVAEELHFRRAAERLHISQPPLSQQIRALEQELGVELLARSRRRVELTPAGATLLVEARAILSAVEHAAELTRSVARGEVGRLSIGFMGSAMYGALPDILGVFRERNPRVDLRLHELSTARQLEALKDGRIDVGVIRPPVLEPDLVIEELWHESVVVALPVGHRLARRRRLVPDDLHGERFVMLDRREAPGLHHSLARLITEIGQAPLIQEVSEIQTVLGLVAAGMGISLIGESVGARERRGVVHRPLSGRQPTIATALAWRPDDDSPVLASFLAEARGRPEAP
ncbi:MAG TPA: LysR substrate-binding domain-containing protein [Solirubrobacteraceae bacterium]|jgi:DNA-binding transcriptional LysR family regulator|nr:LysR substrate-binding domain-containing protein [Solirubrobacteraceae bacterium]